MVQAVSVGGITLHSTMNSDTTDPLACVKKIETVENNYIIQHPIINRIGGKSQYLGKPNPTIRITGWLRAKNASLQTTKDAIDALDDGVAKAVTITGWVASDKYIPGGTCNALVTSVRWTDYGEGPQQKWSYELDLSVVP